MTEDETKPTPAQTPNGPQTAAERGAAHLAEQMPSWWRPEYQSAAGGAPTAAPAAPRPVQAPPAPPLPEPPHPAPAPQPVAVAPPPPPAAPATPSQRPSHEAQTMVLGVVAPAPPIAILTVTAGPDMGFKFRIRPTEITRIGRETDNEVVLDDPATSRHHAQIAYHDGKYVLADLGSANGTLVNDQRVTEKALSDGDLIRVGQNVIRLSIVEPPTHQA